MSTRSDWLEYLRCCSSRVQLPNGAHSVIQNVGEFFMNIGNKLSGVLHLPHFKYNLRLIAKLTKKLDCALIFYPKFVVMQHLCSGKVTGTSRGALELYLFRSPLKYSLSLQTSSIPNPQALLWYRRLGHVSLQTLINFLC